ncbi:MAG: DAK2 domain-containing protein, partial [Nocardia sp.]|nr:DAK2 domain-containing protein [Nocardia sp.]
LSEHRDEINALNVFPVADSDTGTNLLITMRAATDALAEAGQTAPLRVMASASTAAARGNSGILLSQVLRGLADETGAGPLTASTLRAGLRRAAALMRESLSRPVEGTMLTVLEAAADSAADCTESTVAAVSVAAADGAVKALGDTPSQLGVLRAAGVVDAGARGLLVLLDALVQVCTGGAPQRPGYVRAEPDSPAGAPSAASSPVARDNSGGCVDPGDAVPAGCPLYEVMFRVDGTDAGPMDELRTALAELGESVVIVDDGGGCRAVHVHCADAGAAVEAGLRAGTVRDIRIEALVADFVAAPGPVDRGILAVAEGPGAARLFEDEGAVVVTGPVTPESLLAAIRAMPQREVLVLPNGALPAPDLVAVGMAAREGWREVLVLPSLSMVQGLAALALHDAGSLAVDDALTMSRSAAGTRWGAVRRATERALTIVGTCARGDGLGLVGDDVVVIDPDLPRAARTLLDRMLGLGGELVTLLLGESAPDGLADGLTAFITAEYPGVEVVTYDGGQTADLIQIGVE